MLKGRSGTKNSEGHEAHRTIYGRRKMRPEIRSIVPCGEGPERNKK